MNTQIELVLQLAALMAVGILLYRIHLVSAADRTFLSSLVINLILPCNIVSSFLISPSGNILSQYSAVLLVSVGIQAGCLILARCLFRKEPHSRRAPLQYGIVCSNAGFLGTPVAQGLFGAASASHAAIFLIPQRIVMWTIGVSFYTGKTGRTSIRKVLLHPCIAAVFIGIPLMFLPVKIPELISSVVDMIGDCNTPVSMILIGTIIADMDLKLLHHRDVILYTLLRLLGIPLLVFAACTLLKTDLFVRNLCVMLTAMPAGATTTILAHHHRCDAAFASALLTVSTLCSIPMIPVWCAFLGI